MGLLEKLLGRTNSGHSQRPAARVPIATRAAATRWPPLVATPRTQGTLQWVPPGVSTTVAGRTIAGGMIYVGSRARSGDGHSVEPALIDPSLPVDWKRADWLGRTMGYWPSYDHIGPGARAALLTWLNDGRSAPSAYIGYVFVYFYGLERRALIDAKLDPEHPDMNLVVDEVRRLVAIYGQNGSFRSYATRFLDLIDAVAAPAADLEPLDWTALERSWEVPAQARIALGRYAAAGQPIPAEWALVFLRTHPESYLRTPATRCAAEFDELFCARYRDLYGAGMIVRQPSTPIELNYRPASGGLRSGYTARIDNLPDITKIDGPITKLREVAADCTDSLDAYSRYLGRHQDSAGSPAAAGLLPEELLGSHGGPTLSCLREWVATRVADGSTPVNIDELVGKWAPERTAKLAKADSVALAGLLAKFRVGIEPDVRFGGNTPPPGSTAVLFSLPDRAPAAPSPEYAAASIIVHLAAVLASADGSVSDDERNHLAAHLESGLGLNDGERARLEAHLLWLTLGTPGLGGIKRRLEKLDASTRTEIGRFLVDVAAADGVVSPNEITTLTKLYKLLALDEADVYRAVHALGIDTGPVTVRPADENAQRWAIPTEEVPPRPVRLDAAKIQDRLESTAIVAALLKDIFTEDEGIGELDPAASQPAERAERQDLIDGLDAPHAHLAERLHAQRTWTRADAEDLAAELGLPLLDGALDRINEAAIDICGEPLIEGDDVLEINEFAGEELF